MTQVQLRRQFAENARQTENRRLPIERLKNRKLPPSTTTVG